jgi:hypothetical protein
VTASTGRLVASRRERRANAIVGQAPVIQWVGAETVVLAGYCNDELTRQAQLPDANISCGEVRHQ